MLGFAVAQSTVSIYMVRPSKPPSQTWKTFLRNHAEAIAAIDMCVVPTPTFDLLFVFLVLGHGGRRLVWFEVTRHPIAEWLARQITEAFPWTSAPAYLVRDNDPLELGCELMNQVLIAEENVAQTDQHAHFQFATTTAAPKRPRHPSARSGVP